MRAYLLGGRPLHFPFLSGLLRYDCATCDAPCCKGAALGIGGSRELVTLAQAQPRAALFSAPAFFQSPLLSIQAPAERCWFLDSKNRCRVERVLGRDAKPSGCRLFPFVRFRMMGEGVCVLPDFTCPIQVGPEPTETGPTSHDEIALEVHRALIPRSGHPELPPPRDLPWSEAATLERRIVEASARHLGAPSYVPFAELQHTLALTTLGLAGRAAPMQAVEDNVRRFLMVQERPSPATVRELVALTGTMRASASALPRREMTAVLVALSVLAGVAENMRGSVRSPRNLMALFDRHLPLLYALGHLNARPAVRPGMTLGTAAREVGAMRPALLPVLRDVEKNGRRGVAETLEDILRKQQESFAPPLSADAVSMLTSLGHVLMRTCTFVPL